MSHIKDISGKKFNRLTIIKYAYSKKHKSYWLCKCDCGNEKVADSWSLKNGFIKSCGCLRKENGKSEISRKKARDILILLILWFLYSMSRISKIFNR